MGKRRWGLGRRPVSADLRGARRATLAVMALLAAVSCAASQSAAPAPSRSWSGPSNPLALVGMWVLTGVGAEAGSLVGLTPSELTIYRSCGELLASWSADSQGLFTGDITGGSGGCDPETRVTWLTRAAGYRLDGSSHAVLLDAAGGTVARLAASSALPRPDRESFEVTNEFRRTFDPPAMLPARLTPADRRELAGRWIPVRARSKGPRLPYVQLRPDGRWSGSDGCNGSGGGWVAGPAGTLLATSGISTLVGCDNVPVDDWLSSARRAGFDGATLVLLDRDAKELGRLHRDDGGAGITTPPSGN